MPSTSYSSPLLTLHVGQAGIQIGHAAWELLCLEHNIGKDGAPMPQCQEHGNVDVMFESTMQGHYMPRTIFVDTDPLCVDEVRSGPYRELFNSRQLLSDELDAGSNYATGRYGFAKRLLPDTVDRMRWLTEKVDTKPTLFLVHSASGGTGSGFSVACLSRFAEELGANLNALDLCLMPGHMAAQNSCELINTALYLHESHSLVRQAFCVSNSALFRVCSSQLQSNGQATYAQVNRLLAAAFSNLTATERLPGSSVSLAGILDNLLPFRHLKYSLLACAPFVSPESARVDQVTVRGATMAVLESGSQFLDVDPSQGMLAAGFLLYRGAATETEARKLAAELGQKERVQFFDWAPGGFRTGVVQMPPLVPPNSGLVDTPVSVTMVTSHSAVSGVFSELAKSAERLNDGDLFVKNYDGAIVALLSRPGSDQLSIVSSNLPPQPVVAPAATANQAVVGGHNPHQLVSYGTTQSGGSPFGHSPVGLKASKPTRIAGGGSDVFGIRVRLEMAIGFLETAAQAYSVGDLPPTDWLSKSPGWVNLRDPTFDVKMHKSDVHEPSGEETVQSANAVKPTDRERPRGDGGGGGGGTVTGEYESAARWDSRHQLGEEAEAEATQNNGNRQQLQPCFYSVPSDVAEDHLQLTDSIVQCLSCSDSECESRRFGCLLRHHTPPEATAAAAAGQCERHPAIVAAERVLKKYNERLDDAN